MAWRLCTVVVVAVCAWQACLAEDLVSLLQPWQGRYGPGLGLVRGWILFDGDKSTYAMTKRATYGTADWQPYRPSRYRITMAAHVKPADYPTGWRVSANADANSNNVVLDRVSGAVFKNRVYEGVFAKPSYYSGFGWEFQGKREYAIAEIELLGPRAELDALWPDGKYPCSQRMVVATPPRGPKRIFQRSYNDGIFRPQSDWLRRIFESNTWGHEELFFDGTQPILIGGRGPELADVREVVFKTKSGLTESGRGGRLPVKKIILQGNVCEGGHCHKLGSKGWVRLAVATKPRGVGGWPYGARLPIVKPGNYQALRIKLIPSNQTDPNRITKIIINDGGVWFLKCQDK